MSGGDLAAVEAALKQGYPAALETLKAFCRIPSVSTDPAYRDSIRAAAIFVADAKKFVTGVGAPS